MAPSQVLASLASARYARGRPRSAARTRPLLRCLAPLSSAYIWCECGRLLPSSSWCQRAKQTIPAQLFPIIIQHRVTFVWQSAHAAGRPLQSHHPLRYSQRRLPSCPFVQVPFRLRRRPQTAAGHDATKVACCNCLAILCSLLFHRASERASSLAIQPKCCAQ